MTKPDLIPSSVATARLGVNRRTLTRWVAQGRLVPVLQLPGQTGAFLFEPADVDRLATERTSA